MGIQGPYGKGRTRSLKTGINGFRITEDDRGLLVEYGTEPQLQRALLTLEAYGGSLGLPYEEKCSFTRCGAMLDASRNAVPNVDFVKTFLDVEAKLGLNLLMLYTEDTFEVEGEPRFGHLRGRYSKEEIREIDSYASDLGIELVPCIQALGHLSSFLRWPSSAPLRDRPDILSMVLE